MTRKSLPRLTEALVKRAIRKSQPQGWYDLCRQGYTPDEIALYTTYHAPEIRFKIREYAGLMGMAIPACCAKTREYVRASSQPNDPKEAFRSAVMRTGMALVLTQPMLEELCAIACEAQSDRSLHFQALGVAAPNNFIATRAALHKRGLVTCDHPAALTDIGRRVADLLKEADVFVTPDAALEKKGA